MKILHIHDRLEGYGGGEVYFSEVVQGLQEQGHQVARLYLLQQCEHPISQPGLHQLSKPHGYRSGLARRAELLALLKLEAPDVVHLHCLFTPVWLKLILRHYPVVFTLHSVEVLCFLSSKVRADNGQICHQAMGLRCISSGCYKPLNYGGWLYGPYQAWLRWQLLRLLPRLNHLIAPSRRMAEELLAVGVAEDRVRTLPHFTRLGSDAVSQPSPRHVLFVGRLSWEKGVLELLEVLRTMQRSDWTATVVGDGPLFATLKARLDDYQLSDRVQLVGQVARNEVARYYQQASVVVVPSMVPEAFGLAGIEAMACARPVVAFDVGGVNDWLVDGESGFLVSSGDIPQMASRLQMLLDDAGLAARMGQTARAQVEQKFTLPVHLARLLAVYQEAKHHYELEHRH